jgi:hypothetical protein
MNGVGLHLAPGSSGCIGYRPDPASQELGCAVVQPTTPDRVCRPRRREKLRVDLAAQAFAILLPLASESSGESGAH